MDYGNRDLADRLAAEYVLGTLRGPARRRMQALLPAHPELAAAVRRWENRLVPLAENTRPTAPPAQVWQRVQQRLFPEPVVAKGAWWQRLGLWQGAAAASFAAAAVALVLLSTPAPQAPPLVIVLQANPDAAATMNASFVASLSSDGRSLVLRPVNVPAIEATRAFELWAVPAQGAPRSLGLVSASGGVTLQRADLLANTAAFAVSLEPAGGSPTGAPSGPIVSLGRVQL